MRIKNIINKLTTYTPKHDNRLPKNVAIIGWLGAFNLGDEMMLNVSMHELLKRGDKLTILSHKIDDKVKERYEGLNIVSRRPLTNEALAAVVDTNDSLLVNSGALIDDRYYDDSGSLARDIARLSLAFIASNKPVVVYGVSANSNLKNKKLISDYSKIVQDAAYFSTRDTFSRIELGKHFNVDSIKIVDDIVFADNTITQSSQLLKGRPIISVIVVFDKNTIENVKIFFDKLLNATSASIKIIAFYDEDENDCLYIEELKSFLGFRRTRIDEISSPVNSADLFLALSVSDVVFSMRYHGSLFANAMQKQVITIDYDKHPHYFNKNKYLQDNYGFSKASFKLSDIGTMTADDIKKLIDMTEPTEVDINSINLRAHTDLMIALDLL